MQDEIKVNQSILKLIMGDYTDMETDSIVYYATNDLKLGSGFGNAISVRGGPSIQKELDEIGSIKTTDVVVSSAGEMKTKNIIHASGPKFMEADTEAKLQTTIDNCLKLAEEKGFSQIVFPPMGCGFYGVPLGTSAKIMIDTFKKYLSNDTKIKEISISLLDKRDYKPFQDYLKSSN